MKVLTIEIGNHKRIVVYKEGGCYMEKYLAKYGWVLHVLTPMDYGTIEEARRLLAEVTEKVS